MDAARKIAEDLDLRDHDVVIRVRVWSGAETGLGTACDTDTTIDPRPMVRSPSPRWVAGSAGTYEAGDRRVEKISRALTPAQLRGPDVVAANTEILWLIDGDAYKVIGEPDDQTFEWQMHLRRLTRSSR